MSADKFVSEVRSKLAHVGVTARSDIRLVDFSVGGDEKSTVKALFQYDPLIRKANASDLQTWISERIGNKVRLLTASLRQHDSDNAISAMLILNRPTAPLSQTNNLRCVVAGSMYQDTSTGTVWDVKTGEDGTTKYLVARTEDNLQDIFNSLKTACYGPRNQHVTLGSLKGASVVFDCGDKVRFMNEDVPTIGIVESCSGDNCVIKANGASVRVNCMSVMEVIQKSPEAVTNSKAKQNEFFTKVYGPEYAAQLTNRTVGDITNGILRPEADTNGGQAAGYCGPQKY